MEPWKKQSINTLKTYLQSMFSYCVWPDLMSRTQKFKSMKEWVWTFLFSTQTETKSAVEWQWPWPCRPAVTFKGMRTLHLLYSHKKRAVVDTKTQLRGNVIRRPGSGLKEEDPTHCRVPALPDGTVRLSFELQVLGTCAPSVEYHYKAATCFTRLNIPCHTIEYLVPSCFCVWDNALHRKNGLIFFLVDDWPNVSLWDISSTATIIKEQGLISRLTILHRCSTIVLREIINHSWGWVASVDRNVMQPQDTHVVFSGMARDCDHTCRSFSQTRWLLSYMPIRMPTFDWG